MSKVFFIASGFFIETQTKIACADTICRVDVKLTAEGYNILGTIEFKTEKAKETVVMLSIIGACTGQSIPFPEWQKINSKILQQYKGISEVLGNAFLSGFFNADK